MFLKIQRPGSYPRLIELKSLRMYASTEATPEQWFSECVARPVTSPPPGNLLETHILGPQPRQMEGEGGEVCAAIYVFTRLPDNSDVLLSLENH